MYRLKTFLLQTILFQITESGEDRTKRIPSLTSYKSVASAGMIDITNNVSIPWLQKQLQDITSDYQIDAFYLDAGKNLGQTTQSLDLLSFK